MRATLRLHLVLPAVTLLLLLGLAGSRGIDRDWRLNPDLLEALGDLAVCPGCAAIDEDADRYPPRDTERYLPKDTERYPPKEIAHYPPKDVDDDQEKLKRTRKNYSTMEETCECTTDFNKWYFRNLSAGQYPAAVAEINCTEGSCRNCFKPYKCMAHRYDVYVLEARMDDDPVDANVPDLLKNGWKFVTIPINIGCKCTRSEND